VGLEVMRYALDACALIAVLKKEEGALTVNVLFEKAVTEDALLFMSIYNLLEVYYGFIRDHGIDIANTIMRRVDEIPLTIIKEVSDFVYNEAARLKGVYHRISLADAVGLATAASCSAQFVTSDHHELEIIERSEAIQFFWFR
jgi:PIN domain nuclease of toxin-antitoxin system